MKLHLAAWLLACTVLSIGCGSMPGETDLGESQEALFAQAVLYPISDYDDANFNTWFVANPTGEKDCSNYHFANASSGHWGCLNERQTSGAIDGTASLWANDKGFDIYGNPIESWEVLAFSGLQLAIGDANYQRITSISYITLYVYGQSHDGESCILIDYTGRLANLRKCFYSPMHAGVPTVVSTPVPAGTKTSLYGRQQITIRTDHLTPEVAPQIGSVFAYVGYYYQ